MYVANAGKKVMLYLEIEPTKQPRDHATTRCEIGCGTQLMYHPFLLNLAALLVCDRKLGGLHDVGQLKNNSQKQAASNAGNEPAKQRQKPADCNNGNNEINGYVTDHSGTKDEVNRKSVA